MFRTAVPTTRPATLSAILAIALVTPAGNAASGHAPATPDGIDPNEYSSNEPDRFVVAPNNLTEMSESTLR